MKTTVLQVNHLYKTYDQRCVVKDVSFTIQEGECFGLLGHNGAGKSTTLECVLQVRQADQGEVTLFGKMIHQKDKHLYKQIGVQFQENAYPDKMKVKEICELTSAIYPNVSNWRSLLKDFHLGDFENHIIPELSGGERQRLSVLLALLPKPKMLFLDELTTGLDTIARRDIWKYILEYKKQGNSLLLTSHYMDEVEHLCDRIGILKHGAFIFLGTVEEAKAMSQCTTLEEAYLWFHQEDVV